MRFTATLEAAGKTATGIQIPADVVEALGSGRKPPVRITIGAHTFRSTVATRGDRYLVGVSAENRALADHPGARRFFEGLSFSQKQWYVIPIDSAKKPDTRQKRVTKAIEMLEEGRKR